MAAGLLTTAIGVVAGSLSVASFVPQIIKIVRTRDVSGISLGTYGATVVCFALWLTYGLRLSAWPLAVANGLSLTLSGVILVLKWCFGDKGK